MYRRTSSPQTAKSSNSTREMQPYSQELDILDANPEDDNRKGDYVVIDVSESLPNSVKENSNSNSFLVNTAFDMNPEVEEVVSATVEPSNAISEATDDKKSKNSQNIVELMRKKMGDWMRSHSKSLRRLLYVFLLVLYNVYLGFAMHLTWYESDSWCNGIKLLVVMTGIAYSCAFYKVVLKTYCLRSCVNFLSPLVARTSKIKHVGKIVWAAVWGAVLIFLVIDSQGNRHRLISAAGLVVLVFLGYLFSAHPNKVLWRQVQWGILMQFLFGLLILRWNFGQQILHCFAEKVKTFLQYSDQGTAFVFGYLVTGKANESLTFPGIFAFKILCTVIYFSFVISILYYYGWMQALVVNLGWCLQKTLGTTACESISAAGNVFLGMTEAPLIIRPYLPVMTKSELHAVCTGGFATIAGSLLAAYISFGINASHLLSASVMSAPAALAFSKLFYPETEQSTTKAEDIKFENPVERNALEAATNGAITAISLVSNIAANLIAFVAFIGLVNAMLSWFGSLVHWDFLSFEWLLSKLFVPLSLLMGVDWDDKENVAKLIGLKTIINEFVAYEKMAELLKEHSLSKRSEAIATFALCGFSNISSIGIQLGSLGAMAPERKSDLASMAIRAMIAGSAACFMTACVAGTLITDAG